MLRFKLTELCRPGLPCMLLVNLLPVYTERAGFQRQFCLSLS